MLQQPTEESPQHLGASAGVLQRLTEQLAQRLGAAAKVETVFGEAQEHQGKTVIPVARVAYGFGLGAGEGQGGDAEHGGGGGGGGGVSVRPLGALIITETDERFLPFRTWRSAMLPAFFGFLFGLYVGRRAYRHSS